MLLFLTIAIILFLVIITYQDFKERKISWLSIPALVLFFSWYAVIDLGSWRDYFLNVTFNLLFIAIQLSTLFIYFSIKAGKFTNLINSKIGIGDILFFVALTFAFTTVNFILFYVGSLSIITISFLFAKLFFKNVSPQIPLAGAMAAILILWYLISLFFPSLHPLNNLWLL